MCTFGKVGNSANRLRLWSCQWWIPKFIFKILLCILGSTLKSLKALKTSYSYHFRLFYVVFNGIITENKIIKNMYVILKHHHGFYRMLLWVGFPIIIFQKSTIKWILWVSQVILPWFYFDISVWTDFSGLFLYLITIEVVWHETILLICKNINLDFLSILQIP